MRAPARHPSRSRLLAGLAVIAGGCLLLLNNLGIVSLFGVLQFWPTVFMLFGGLLLYKGGALRRYLTGGLLLALGLLMTLNQAGVIAFSLQQWWPLLLIYAGLMLLLPRARRTENHTAGKHWQREHDNGNEIRRKLFMAGSELRSEAEDFRRGELSLVMSGLKLDLRDAQLQGQAELRVEMMLAGLELRVPPDWLIEVDVSPLMGGIENKTTPPLHGDKRLILRGEVVMSGIEIRN